MTNKKLIGALLGTFAFGATQVALAEDGGDKAPKEEKAKKAKKGAKKEGGEKSCGGGGEKSCGGAK